jgi:hypothetical protein
MGHTQNEIIVPLRPSIYACTLAQPIRFGRKGSMTVGPPRLCKPGQAKPQQGKYAWLAWEACPARHSTACLASNFWQVTKGVPPSLHQSCRSERCVRSELQYTVIRTGFQSKAVIRYLEKSHPRLTAACAWGFQVFGGASRPMPPFLGRKLRICRA